MQYIRIKNPLLTLGLATLVALHSHAKPLNANENSNIIYNQAYFSAYNVSTAEDMLRRIPGVNQILDDAENQQAKRGFGSSGDQILINGERLVGKSNDIIKTIRRIQQVNVQQIELINGTESGTNVNSDGILVNILLKEGEQASSVLNWDVSFLFNDHGYSVFDGLITYSNSWDKLNYLLSIETENMTTSTGAWADRTRSENYFSPTNELISQRELEESQRRAKTFYTANLNYDLNNGDLIALNTLVETWRFDTQASIDVVKYDSSGNIQLRVIETVNRDIIDRLRYELGGNYRKNIGTKSELNVIILYNYRDQPTRNSRTSCQQCTSSNPVIKEINKNTTNQIEEEKILRTTYRKPVTDHQQITVGFEIAQNILEQNIKAALDLDKDGKVEPVNFPTAYARIKEDRFEPFVNHKWTISEKLSLDSSIVWEQTQISHNFDYSPEQEYQYLKPRIDIRYRVSEKNILGIKFERTVSQLDLNEFVPKFDFDDSEIDLGNPELSPEKKNIYEVRIEHRLANDEGVLSVRSFYHNISDHIDKIIIGRDNNGKLISASGNIDKAYLYGGELTTSFRLSKINLQDMVVNGRLLRNYSSTIDPFSGKTRSLWHVEKLDWELGLQHDITRFGVSYGISYAQREGKSLESDLKNTAFLSSGSVVDAYIEKQLSDTISLRFDAYGVTKSKIYRDRIIYADNASDGGQLRTENYTESRDRRFSLSLKGVF